MKNKVKRNTEQQQKKTQVEIKKWNDVNKNNEINKYQSKENEKFNNQKHRERTFWVIYNANNCLAPPPESKSEEKSVISF